MRFAVSANDARASSPQIRCCDTANFVTSDEVMIRQIRAWSGGLVEVVKNTKGNEAIVQVIHQSVNDFLLSRGLEMLEQQDMSSITSTSRSSSPDITEVIRRCHGTLYRCCLTWYATTDFAAIIEQLINGGTYGSGKKHISARLPLIGYVTGWMFYHAEKAGCQRSEDLEKEVQILDRIKHSWMIWCYRYTSYAMHRLFPRPGLSVLHIAAYHNLVDLAERLVQAGHDIDVQDEKGSTALHLAAARGHIRLIEVLCLSGAQINIEDKDGKMPLALAAGGGHLEVVGHFLAYKSRQKSTTDTFTQALYAATDQGHIAIVRLLISAGAELNAHGGYYGTALQIASLQRDEEMIQLLLEAGADVNAPGSYLGSALQIASYVGDIDIVRILLEAGADVTAQGGCHSGALQAAFIEGRKETVQLLLDAGAKWSSETEEQRWQSTKEEITEKTRENEE